MGKNLPAFASVIVFVSLCRHICESCPQMYLIPPGPGVTFERRARRAGGNEDGEEPLFDPESACLRPAVVYNFSPFQVTFSFISFITLVHYFLIVQMTQRESLV